MNFDRLFTRAVTWSGFVVGLLAVAVIAYLFLESSSIFRRDFSYGFRIALQPEQLQPDPYTGEIETDLSLDPNATLIGANREGTDGLDEREELAPLPTVAEMDGVSQFATAVNHRLEDGSEIWCRDDLRSPTKADRKSTFTLIGFATPEYKGERMGVAWQPDAGFDPRNSPFDFKLKIERFPDDSAPGVAEVNLTQHSSGRILIPSHVAATDADRFRGYRFSIVAEPSSSQFFASIGNLFTTVWSPTGIYESFGAIPLFVSTILLTLFATMLAAPVGFAAAVFLNETAHPVMRKYLKAAVEVLASIPTVVLAYIALLLLAPALVAFLGAPLGLTSGRNFLAAGVTLAVLLLPYMVTLSDDAIRTVPSHMQDAARSLGLTKSERLRHVALRQARPAVVVAVLLTLARGVGETMIVWILAGGTVTMPKLNPLESLVSPTRGVPDTIAVEMGNVEFGGTHYGYLFAIGTLLFLFTFALNQLAHRLTLRYR